MEQALIFKEIAFLLPFIHSPTQNARAGKSSAQFFTIIP
ncbi:hypothetical protein RV12_GL001006 [Enterococcus quebecensis]|nr:hypothetical protein RV12_GL001006 [Enterococcus quebecensis]